MSIGEIILITGTLCMVSFMAGAWAGYALADWETNLAKGERAYADFLCAEAMAKLSRIRTIIKAKKAGALAEIRKVVEG